MRILIKPNEMGNIIELGDDEKKELKDITVKLEQENGIEGFSVGSMHNSYDNDDYLFLCHLIQRINFLYRIQNMHTPTVWRKGYREVPYIHLEMVDFRSSYIFDEETGTPTDIDDKKLIIRVNGPVLNGDKERYNLYVDEKLLQQYAKFLSSIFIEMNDDTPQVIRFSGMELTALKPIFSTTGFKEYHSNPLRVFGEVLQQSLMTILAHEFTHISNAHLKLMDAEQDYCSDSGVAFCLESNADDNAIRILLSSLLYMGQRDPGDYNLALSYSELVDQWCLGAFSAFVAITWAYKGHNREWNTNTFSDYMDSISRTHPLYQMRAFNVISRAVNHMFAILGNEDTYIYRTSDGYQLDEEMAEYIVQKTIDMIRSFDYCLYYCDEPDRGVTERLLNEQAKSNELTHLPSNKLSPIPLLFEDEDALALNDSIKAKWSEVKQKLEEYSPYSMLFETI